MKIARRAFLAAAAAPAFGAAPNTAFDRYFLEILEGYLRNARRTSPSMAVCDFEGGTILKGAAGKSGKTYDSVTRMLPAMASWVAGNREAQTPELLETLRLAFRNAFDPTHPDYWLPAAPDRWDQRQVESSVVAWSLWLLRDKLLPRLTSPERANIQAWLAGCTRQQVRRNNWAWFTAVNQAVRLSLAAKWKEFSGDEQWMLEDLKFLATLAAPGSHGWYTDAAEAPTYDYYNFWVFASHFLYWNRVIGARYPEWSRRFAARLRPFLEKTPCFFGANGAHVLFGRSLIYRFAVLTPLVLAYEQKLWPHSPGLLRAIVRRNLEHHWELGAFDRERGKLRETYSARGNRAICESYVDNGHPYWGMQAFALFLIPPRDPFWTAPEEPLPVERADFLVRFESLGMLLAGSRASGQVRWMQAQAFHGGGDYVDKYAKFSYSSHFPFNIAGGAALDNALIFRDPASGKRAGRAGVKRGALTDGGLETEWWAVLDGRRIDVTTRIELDGRRERRGHTINGPVGIEALEGSYALGLADGEQVERPPDGLRSPSTNLTVFARGLSGQAAEVDLTEGANIVYPRAACRSARPLGDRRHGAGEPARDAPVTLRRGHVPIPWLAAVWGYAFTAGGSRPPGYSSPRWRFKPAQHGRGFTGPRRPVPACARHCMLARCRSVLHCSRRADMRSVRRHPAPQ